MRITVPMTADSLIVRPDILRTVDFTGTALQDEGFSEHCKLKCSGRAIFSLASTVSRSRALRLVIRLELRKLCLLRCRRQSVAVVNAGRAVTEMAIVTTHATVRLYLKNRA